MSDLFTFPPLVSTYLLDPRVQNAVDDLTKSTMAKGFDTQFSWNEFPGYVATWLAAQHVVAEWCTAQFELWDASWGHELGGAPDYANRIESDDLLSAGGVYECWQEGWVSRHVNVNDRPIGLAVECDVDVGEVKISIEFSEELTPSLRRELESFGWSLDRASDAYTLASLPIKIERAKEGYATLDVAKLLDYASAALSVLRSNPHV